MAHSGTLGTCSWTITDGGTLNIGSGTLPNYMPSSGSWLDYRTLIKRVSIGVRSSGTVYGGSGISGMFANCTNLVSVGITGTFNLTNTIDMSYVFEGCTSLTTVDLTGISNTNNVDTISGLFYDCSSLKTVDLSMLNTSNVTSMDMMFYGCINLTSVNLSSFNTSNVETMRYMFYNCQNLKTLSLSSFNSSSVQDATRMFTYCSSLTSLTLGRYFTLSHVTDFSWLFGRCSSLTRLNLNYINTSSATTMEDMFAYCGKLNAITFGTNFVTTNVVNMSCMFYQCSNLTSLNLSGFNTAKVLLMDRMFYGCSKLSSLDLSAFNTSKVTNMQHMFAYCSSLQSLNISSFNTTLAKKNSKMTYMFHSCPLLVTIIVGANFKPHEDMQFVQGYNYAINTKNNEAIRIQSSKDMCGLTSSQISGTWTRTNSDVIYTVVVGRSHNGAMVSTGEDATFNITYSTPDPSEQCKLYIYKKATTTASYPSTSEIEKTLSGDFGTTTITLSDIGNLAYDFKVELHDGDDIYILFPSISANMQLVKISSTGSLSIFLDESAEVGTEDGDLCSIIRTLGWTACIE